MGGEYDYNSLTSNLPKDKFIYEEAGDKLVFPKSAKKTFRECYRKFGFFVQKPIAGEFCT